MRGKKFLMVLSSTFLIFAFCKNVNANTVTERIAGSNRYLTSLETVKKTNSSSIILASGQNFADALSAVNIANSQNAKILLVESNQNISDVLKEKKVEKVYIIGGENTLSKNFENNLKKDFSVLRLSGNNRYETNKNTLSFTNVKEVGVADGRNFPDALSATALLKQKDYGLMLVNGAKPYKTDLNVKYTFGSSDSILQNGGKRISGENRFETALKIVSEMDNLDKFVLVNGYSYPDALSAINLLDKTTAVIPVSKDSKNINLNSNIDKISIVGGENSISTKLIEQILNPKNTSYESINLSDLNSAIEEDDSNNPLNQNTNTANTIVELRNQINNILLTHKYTFNGNKAVLYCKNTTEIKSFLEKLQNEKALNGYLNGLGYEVSMDTIFENGKYKVTFTFKTSYEFFTGITYDNNKRIEIDKKIKSILYNEIDIKNTDTDQEKMYKILKYTWYAETQDGYINGSGNWIYNYGNNTNLSEKENYALMYSPYTVFDNKTGVCAAFSLGFDQLARAAGLECITSKKVSVHQYNLIKLNGNWTVIEPQSEYGQLFEDKSNYDKNQDSDLIYYYEKGKKLLKELKII